MVKERGTRRTWNLFQEQALTSTGHDCKCYTRFTDVLLESVQLLGDVRSEMLGLYWENAAAKCELQRSEMPVTYLRTSSSL